MPRRRAQSARRPASGLDDFDFEWILVPWDAALGLLVSAWASLGAGFRAVRLALGTQRSARYFAVLFVLALGLRLVRPDWYAHSTFHPDERWIFDKTSQLSWPQEPGKTDAGGMQYGSLPLYVVGAAKDLATHVSRLGAYDAVILWGRGLTGCVDALTVLATFLLATQLVGAMPALLAALVIATSPLHILFSHFFTVDPWLACFVTFALAACVRVARRPSLGWSACTGVLCAAALASKTSGLPLVLPIALAHLWPALAPGLTGGERRARLKRAGIGLAVAAGAALAAFAAFMPWAFLDFQKFVANQQAQEGILVTGSPMGTPFVRQYWDTGILFHLKNVCLFYLGLPTGLLALLAVPLMGCLAGLKVRRAWAMSPSRTAQRKGAEPEAPAAWNEAFGPLLLLAWVLPYFLIVSLSFAKFARYMLPVLPALAVLLVLALAWLRTRFERSAWILVALTFLFSLGYGTGYFFTYLHPHPWLETSAWTYAQIPPTVVDPAAPGGRRGTRILNEDWGDDLPVSLPGHSNNYDNLKDRPGQVDIVEWDSADKLARFCNSLSQADVLYLADPRAYGTYLRLPKRFPLTHAYYTLLFSDPGKLGFTLAHESSNPIRLFGLFPLPDSRTPDVPQWRWADESFTLYDRPHAFVFRRSVPKNPDEIRAALLGEVQALHLSDGFLRGLAPDVLEAAAGGEPLGSAAPAAPAPANGVEAALPAGMVNRNFGMSRGTLSPLGNPVLVWWFLVSVLGLLALPLTTRLFKGFPAGGYALSRALGVFLFGWLAYNLALLFPGLMPFWQSRLWLLLAFGAAALALAVRRKRASVAAWLKSNRGEILFTEAVFAAAFLFFVLVRAYNPNIHDTQGQGYFGGGEPLGMTYLSAVSRCATFPAYDPWLSLANSSYYYFGYVLAATLTKLSGIAPSITYNLSLSLFFSLTLLSAFGLLRGLVSKKRLALCGAAMVAMAGSLWTVAYIAIQAGHGTGWFDALFSHGFIWDPTRFPDLVNGHIFEFPFFSYLYGDLHPHNIVLGFSILLAALFLKPFLAPEGGWRSFGSSPLDAGLWLLVVALLLDAQYAINTWSWPVFLALGGVCMVVGPWAGKRLGVKKSALAAAWGLAFFLLAVGPCPWLSAGHLGWRPLGIGPLLMSGFRSFFLQDGATRLGTVHAGEWQMSAYIPIAYYLPGLLALAALGGMRVHAWAQSMAKPLGFQQLKRRDSVEKALILGERYLGRFPLPSMVMALMLLVISLLVLWATANWQTQGVWALSLGLGLSCLGLFMMGGFASGSEAYLWTLGACFCFMVCGVEFKFVADRMNTIFKVWMNGWVLMGLVFGAGFASAFDQGPAPALKPVKTKAKPVKTKAKRRRLPPSLVIPCLAALALVLLVALAAGADARLLGRGGRFLVSYLAFGLLLLSALGLGAFYGKAPWWRWARQGLFYGLLALGLLYPLGAVGRRIWEASQFKDPHLDGLTFMGQRDARMGYADEDYDRHDYALITWLNRNAPLTETVVEAPGLELYKGFDRFSIYTGLPTLLGWDYQVGQQLGERTGGILDARKRDAAVIYGTDSAAAAALLKFYHARWIVVGSLERKLYPAAGLEKFKNMASVAAQDGPSVLYRYDWDKP